MFGDSVRQIRHDGWSYRLSTRTLTRMLLARDY